MIMMTFDPLMRKGFEFKGEVFIQLESRLMTAANGSALRAEGFTPQETSVRETRPVQTSRRHATRVPPTRPQEPVAGKIGSMSAGETKKTAAK